MGKIIEYTVKQEGSPEFSIKSSGNAESIKTQICEIMKLNPEEHEFMFQPKNSLQTDVIIHKSKMFSVFLIYLDNTSERIITKQSKIVSQLKDGRWFAHKGRPLNPEKSLEDHGIVDECILHEIQPLDVKPKAGMLLYVKTLTGKNIELFVDPNAPITTLQRQIQMAEGILPDQQRFIFAGMQLEEDKSLADYKITAESTVHLVLRLR